MTNNDAIDILGFYGVYLYYVEIQTRPLIF